MIIIIRYYDNQNQMQISKWRKASGTWFGEIPFCCCLTRSAWLCLEVSPNHVPEAVRHSRIFLFFRLLEMRMPRTSSFSVRDILDLPQMKASASASDDTQTSTPTAALAGNAGENGQQQQTALPFPPNGKYQLTWQLHVQLKMDGQQCFPVIVTKLRQIWQLLT